MYSRTISTCMFEMAPDTILNRIVVGACFSIYGLSTWFWIIGFELWQNRVVHSRWINVCRDACCMCRHLSTPIFMMVIGSIFWDWVVGAVIGVVGSFFVDTLSTCFWVVIESSLLRIGLQGICTIPLWIDFVIASIFLRGYIVCCYSFRTISPGGDCDKHVVDCKHGFFNVKCFDSCAFLLDRQQKSIVHSDKYGGCKW